MPDERLWSTALRQTFRLLPAASDALRVFLQSDGRHKDEVLAALPYEAARAGGGGTLRKTCGASKSGYMAMLSCRVGVVGIRVCALLGGRAPAALRSRAGANSP